MTDLQPQQDDTSHHLRDLLKAVKTAIHRVNKKIEKQNAELLEAGNWHEFQMIGDSLVTQKGMIRKGASEAEIKNVHTQQPVTVRLNPKLNVVDNAQLFFKKARKGKRGLEICSENIRLSNIESGILQRLLMKVEQALQLPGNAEEFLAAVAAIDEMIQQGGDLLAPFRIGRAEKKAADALEKVPYRRYDVDGWIIYIGKNDAQNDELSVRYARPWFVWLHVVAHAGSHVVIVRDKNAPWPPASVIEAAAGFAVWFSKAKHTSYAEVHVTEARFVHKRRKSPPGEVIAERCKVIRVAPVSPEDFFRNR